MRTLMKPRFGTPRELVDGLHQRSDGARGRLWEAVREPVARLMRELIAHRRLDPDANRLTLHALHLAETWVRTRPPGEFERLSWDAFRNAVLMQIGRLALQPFGGRIGRAGGGPAPLPECPAYQNETFSLPFEQSGEFWFGGDWYGGRRTADGSLWVIVADVTGHGYYAYLLASVLPNVWEACWKKAPADVRPAGLLRAMHELLESCLPEGVYAECTLVRLSPEGEATVAPAGGTRLLLRRQGEPASLLKLRGGWLGLLPPSSADQRSWTLAEGDELLLGSDGAFDHLAELDGAGVPGRPTEASLLEDVRRLLRQALKRGPQKDDITLVSLRRVGAGRTAAVPISSLRKGADDVSV